jgi:hypothetical protein
LVDGSDIVVTTMLLADDELVRRFEGTVAFAPAPRRAVWTFGGLTSRDGHVVHGSVTFGLAVPSDPTDRKMLVEVIPPGRASARAVDVVAHLSPVMTEAARDVISSRNAGAGRTDARDSLLDAVRTAGAAGAFAWGVELVGPFSLTVESPSLAAESARETERARAEADATERARHVRRASELAAVITGGTTSPAAILESTAPADRPAALSALLSAGERDAPVATLYVVAGNSLCAIDACDGASPTLRTIAQSTDGPIGVGALRSVQFVHIGGRKRLVIGGQRGIALDAEGDAPAAYLDEGNTSRLGFNAVAYVAAADELWASHSERGIVRWSRAGGSTSVTIITSPGEHPGASDLVSIDPRHVAFASGPAAFVATTDQSSVEIHRGPAPVVGIVVHGQMMHVVHEDGAWVSIELHTWRVLSRRTTGGAVSAVGSLPWVGGVRLLIAYRDGAIDCLGTDDALVTRYSSAHAGFRAVTASVKRVVGMTGDRQRLVTWCATDGRQSAFELHVAQRTGHRVAGFAFG